VTNEQALQTTVLPTEMLGPKEACGAVAPSCLANIVAAGDPLTNIGTSGKNA
jgi:hypothetical protein